MMKWIFASVLAIVVFVGTVFLGLWLDLPKGWEFVFIVSFWVAEIWASFLLAERYL